MSSKILELPDLVLARILFFLDSKSLSNLRLVSSTFKNLVDSNSAILSKLMVEIRKLEEFEKFIQFSENGKILFNNFAICQVHKTHWGSDVPIKKKGFPLLRNFIVNFAPNLRIVWFEAIRLDFLRDFLHLSENLVELSVMGLADYRDGKTMDFLQNPLQQLEITFNEKLLEKNLQNVKTLSICAGPHCSTILHACKNVVLLKLQEPLVEVSIEHGSTEVEDPSVLPQLKAWLQYRLESGLKSLKRIKHPWWINAENFLDFWPLFKALNVKISKVYQISLPTLSILAERKDREEILEGIHASVKSVRVHESTKNYLQPRNASTYAEIEVFNEKAEEFELWGNVKKLKICMFDHKNDDNSRIPNYSEQHFLAVERIFSKLFIARKELVELEVRMLAFWNFVDENGKIDIHDDNSMPSKQDKIANIWRTFDFSKFPNVRKLTWWQFYHGREVFFKILKEMKNLEKIEITLHSEITMEEADLWQDDGEEFGKEFLESYATPNLRKLLIICSGSTYFEYINNH